MSPQEKDMCWWISCVLLLALLCTVPQVHGKARSDSNATNTDEGSGSGSGFSSPLQPSPTLSTMLTTSALPMETPVPTPVPYVVFANRDTIYHVNLDETDFRPLVANQTSILNNTIAIDYDIRRNYLFWSDLTSKKIIQANLDGSDQRVIVSDGLSLVDGLAWDWINSKLYWTDSKGYEIEVFDITTGHRRKLIDTGIKSIPRGIILDPGTRYMYWTDWGHPAKIERASMDGTARETLHNTSLVWPNDITIDYESQTIYWVDAKLDKIESSHVDGSNRRLISEAFVLHPFSISFHQGVLYWSDWSLNQVVYTQLPTEGRVKALVPGLRKDPMGVKVVALEVQPLGPSNPCLVGNGGCSHLCLLRAGGDANYSCSCPTGVELDDNGILCNEVTTTPPVTVDPTAVGSCIEANYTDCCIPSDTEDCEGTVDCYCDDSCLVFEDCCPDFFDICSITTSTTEPPHNSMTSSTSAIEVSTVPPAQPSSQLHLTPTTASTYLVETDAHSSTQTPITSESTWNASQVTTTSGADLAASPAAPSPAASIVVPSMASASGDSEASSIPMAPYPSSNMASWPELPTAVKVQSSPALSALPKGSLSGISRAVIGTVMVVFAVIIMALIVLMFTLIMIRKRKSAAVVTYEMFDTPQNLEVTKCVELTKNPSFVDNTDSGIDSKVGSEA